MSQRRRTSGIGLLWGAVFALGLAGAPASADYSFVVEPIYGPQKAAEVYKPLIDYLTKATGEKFTLVAPRNYHFYWRDLRANEKFDFAFDEAHLADYRMARFQFVPNVGSAENAGGEADERVEDDESDVEVVYEQVLSWFRALRDEK